MNQQLPPIDDVYEVFVGPIPNRGDAQRNLRVRCPSQQHRDEHPSCSLDSNKGVWFCHGCGRSGGVLDLVIAAGEATDHSSASQRLRSEFPQYTKPAGGHAQSAYRWHERHIARYLYTDGDRAIFAVDRFESKDGRKRFVQSRPGDDGEFRSGRGIMEGIPRIPFRLNELRAAISRGDDIFVTEGEKCAIVLADLGLQATTSAQGANWRWTAEFAAYFRGAKRVFVLADSDRAGREAAHRNAKMLLGLCSDVRMIDFAPERFDGYDVADWLVGKEASELFSLAERTQRFVEHNQSVPALNVVRLADVQGETVEWLWTSRIPVGKLTLLVGDPGIGKSWASIAIAAHVTNGVPLPGGDNPAKPGSVLMWNGEDGTADTIRPRAEALAANLERFHVIESDLDVNGKLLPFSLASVSKIEDELYRLGDVRLIIIDPIAALMGSIDTYKDSQVRTAMQPLIDLAAKARVAVVCVMHMKKAETDRVIHRVGGSIGFVGAARSVLLTAHDEVSGRSGIVPIKQNLAAPVDTVEYSISDGRFNWVGVVSDLPTEVLMRSKPKRESARESALSRAKMAILELLSDHPMPALELNKQLENAGHSERTVERARVELRNEGEIDRSGGGNGGPITWSIAAARDESEQAAMLF